MIHISILGDSNSRGGHVLADSLAAISRADGDPYVCFCIQGRIVDSHSWKSGMVLTKGCVLVTWTGVQISLLSCNCCTSWWGRRSAMKPNVFVFRASAMISDR
jgi:hypothetical protein